MDYWFFGLPDGMIVHVMQTLAQYLFLNYSLTMIWGQKQTNKQTNKKVLFDRDKAVPFIFLIIDEKKFQVCLFWLVLFLIPVDNMVVGMLKPNFHRG